LDLLTSWKRGNSRVPHALFQLKTRLRGAI
jgi:hypothetical protein